MTSRLDRLFVLIETGSSGVTRKAAAQQLGEVVKYHPQELNVLLNRLLQLLLDSSWDTRIAASQAVEAVCQNIPQWVPPVKQIFDRSNSSKKLIFEKFDIHYVIKSSAPLMASDNLEFSNLGSNSDIVKQQVEMINSNLNGGIAIQNIVCDNDLQLIQFTCSESDGKRTVYEVLNLDNISSSSVGIRSKLKRKIKLEHNSEENLSNGGEVAKKRVKTECNDSEPFLNSNDTDIQWPFESFCLKLRWYLFNPQWEVRHGAACALREVIKIHGKTAGLSAGLDKADMEIGHQAWLEDLSLHLLCVLGLDRFGDFISDQVVAPVRETCAQCLGIVINLMSKKNSLLVVNLLKVMLEEKEWEIRHGALLGIKYSLAVREDLQDSILTEVFPLILACFGDPIDDVCAEAASALNPVCSKIVRLMPESVPDLVNQLWKLLSSQDELGVACNSFMTLIASLFMNPEAQSSVSSEMVYNLIPYLWSYLYHNSSSVRKSALQTIQSLSDTKQCINRWTQNILTNTMRHLYQRVLLESINDIRNLAEEAWYNIVENTELVFLRKISSELLSLCLCLAMQSPKYPFDETLFIFERRKQISANEFEQSENAELKLYLGGNETVPQEIREGNVMYIRCMTSRLLGFLLDKVADPNSTENFENVNCSFGYFCSVLSSHLNSKSALQRTIAALTLTEWAQRRIENCPHFASYVNDRLQQCLLESIYFDEIALSYTKILQDTRDYIRLLQNHSIHVEEHFNNKVLRLEEIQSLTNEKNFTSVSKKVSVIKDFNEIQERRLNIHSMACQMILEQNVLSIMSQAVIAGTALTLQIIPGKWSPVIKPLMDSIKKEENELLQKLSATHLSRLVTICVDRDPCPNSKIILNLCSFLCSDPEFTGRIVPSDPITFDPKKPCCNKFNGILTLSNQQKDSERILLRRASNNSNNRIPGSSNSVDCLEDNNSTSPDQVIKSFRIQRQGATYALIQITKLIGANLKKSLSILWDFMYLRIKEARVEIDKNSKDADLVADKLVCNLQVFEVLCPHIHETLLLCIAELMDTLCELLNHPYCAVRHMAARCISVLATRNLVLVVQKLTTLILPFVNAADSVTMRQGGVEAIAALVDKLKLDIIPYIVLLIIPLLGRMSDQDPDVRCMASHTFGMLIQLMPLETTSSSPLDLPEELHNTVEEQRLFLNQLLNPKCIPDFKLSVEINTSLRTYQQCGVNWLAFLNKYQLHGILCDDMGLGKTLQSLCILAEDHHKRATEYKVNKRADSGDLPSLVVCPPTLIGHWIYEIKKFVPRKYLKPLQYEGIPAERERLRSTVSKYNLIIASYDVVRKDIKFFSAKKWNYCILDEGHMIKNGKTKIAKAIKQLNGNHRLILSGTPIQNNVLELWSLFDYLMPGYLGTEKQFCSKFSKPILSSRDPKSSLKEQEAGVIAMETLHQKVLPFILRRMKTDVLNDLPPKITQDYYCDLSPIQKMLYEDFSKSEMQKKTLNAIKESKSCNAFSMFQALRYLQSVCNHPKLVVTSQHPLYDQISCKLECENSSLNDIKHATKLVALKQLLLDCGIGGSLEGDDMIKSNCIVSQHRALIFCQLKATLEILETDLFKVHLPNVTYLRLDGSVTSNQRHKIVTAFNEDPSIDVLLLTTHIGGLGLNLTGADTVIFVEHDWSPMKDLQAMDRAHRIGQKKVVNVYRLITKFTLEQKIMGLQEFKLKTANTIITAENSSLLTMSTEKLLDLFALNNTDMKESTEKIQSPSSSSSSNSTSEFIKSLPELWDAKDYDEEYDLTTFVSSLR